MTLAFSTGFLTGLGMGVFVGAIGMVVGILWLLAVAAWCVWREAR